MNHNILHHHDMNAIIFEGRNQSYGAYELRQHYESRMVKGLLSGSTLFLISVIIPFFLQLIRKDVPEVIPDFHKVVYVQPFIPEKKIKPAEIKSGAMPQPPTPQLKFVPPSVVREDDPRTEELPPSVDTLSHAATGTIHVDTGGYVPATNVPDLPISTAPADPVIPDPGPMQSFAVQEQPEFPNGMSALYAFLSREIKYTAVARENGISGTVYIEFVVGKNGHIENVRILRGIGGGLDQEALRVVNLMPPWKPGKHNGRAVPVIMRLPVKFELLL